MNFILICLKSIYDTFKLLLIVKKINLKLVIYLCLYVYVSSDKRTGESHKHKRFCLEENAWIVNDLGVID